MSIGDETDSDNVREDLSLRRAQRAAYSDATRYLCAAGELDEDFANQVFNELFTQYRRSVAPSFGIDLVPIVKHCVKGRHRRTLRDLVLMLLLVAELALFPIQAAVTILIVFLLRQTNLQLRLGGRAVGQILVAAAIIVGALVLFGPSIRVPKVDWTELRGVTGQLNLNQYLVSLVVALFLAFLIRYAEWHYGQWLVGSHLRDTTFDPNATRVTLSGRMGRRLDAIADQQYGEVTLFQSSVDLPFVGAGTVGRWWSFALHMHPRTDPGSTEPGEVLGFTPQDLHNYVEERLVALRRPEAGLAYGLPGLEISDHIFGPGWYRLEGEPPHLLLAEGRLMPAQIDRIINGPASSLRHFQCLRAEWQGRELVATTFLHLATEGRTLYIELTPCLLSPIRGVYKNVDNWNLPKPEEMGKEMGRAIRDVLPTLFGAPLRLARSYGVPYLERLRYERDDRRVRTRRYSPDYGARKSVREIASVEEPKNYLQLFDPEKYILSPRRYLQLLDAEKYTKTIEVQVLDAISDFLDAHGVDTSEFRTRRAMVLDQKVFISSVQADILTVVQGETGSQT